MIVIGLLYKALFFTHRNELSVLPVYYIAVKSGFSELCKKGKKVTKAYVFAT